LIGKGMSAWRSVNDPDRKRGPRLLVTVLVIGVVSLIVAAATSGWVGLAVLGASLLLVPAGLALSAEDAPSVPWFASAQAPWWGVGFIGLGVLGLGLTGIGIVATAFVAITLIAIVATNATRSAHDIVLVIVLIALVWALDPQSGPDQPKPTHEKHTLLALGDSYMSGEGATQYYAGTNTRVEENTRNECRRAPTAYPVVAQQALNKDSRTWSLVFLACSGAVGKNFTSKPQYRGEPIIPWGSTEAPTGDRSGEVQLDQARDAVSKLDLADPEIVLVQIGGNDAGFGDLGQTCGLPGDCSRIGEDWLDRLEHSQGPDKPSVRSVLADTYAAIHSRYPDAHVLVIPYPIPLNESGCRFSVLRPNEHRYLAGFTRALDQVVREEATKAGFDFLSSAVELFTNAKTRICDTSPSDADVNSLAASPIAGPFLQQVSPRTWFHNTFHPTTTGHARVAAEVVKWIERTESDDAATTPTSPPSTVPRTLTGIMGPKFEYCGGGTTRHPSFCRDTRSEWSAFAVARLLLRLALPAMLLVAGSLIVSVAVLIRWRALRNPAPIPQS
jgi:lysophospholipase L1-like esterase